MPSPLTRITAWPCYSSQARLAAGVVQPVDPYERFNVAEDHPDVVERLRAQMTAFAQETGATVNY